MKRFSALLLALVVMSCNFISADPPAVEPDGADATETGGSARNDCGGLGALLLGGDPVTVGAPCGCGGVVVCAGLTVARCAGEVPPNACGTCGALAGAPGTPCGPCEDGTWECDAAGVQCVGAATRNLCGGCTVLAGALGAPCAGAPDSAWECNGPEAVLCAASGRNVCGGTDTLEHDGIEAAPGDSCEAECGPGRLRCDGEARALICDGPTPNACGGCGPLLGAVGEACGCGGAGLWECLDEAGEIGTACSAAGPNACGGCGPLSAPPGEECDGGGVRICVSASATACVRVPGESNACGGVLPLASVPGTACGACASGTVSCAGPDGVECAGDLAAAAFNDCGGCAVLMGAEGGACGTCGQGAWTCDGTALTCTDDLGDGALNACGGCGVLPAEPDAECGPCAAWRCLDRRLQCLPDAGASGCDGERILCADLDCASESRECEEATLTRDAACGPCVDGYEEDGGACVRTPDPRCGDGVVNGSEQCDGEVPAGLDCVDLEFTGGDLTCAETCTLDEGGCVLVPDVRTSPVDAEDVQAISALVGGVLVETGVPAATQHGLCVGPSGDPALGALGVTCAELGAAPEPTPFAAEVIGLTPGREYHARAFATNAVATVYGGDQAFTTRASVCGDEHVSGDEECDGVVPEGSSCVDFGFSGGDLSCDVACRTNTAGCVSLPVVTTDEIDPLGIEATTVVLGGTITELGVPAPTAHGFCVGASADPALDTADADCSTLGPAHIEGAFDDTQRGLVPGTTYHVRAYAANAAGTAYGMDRSFTTALQTCGDATVSGAEQCDGVVPDGVTCVTLGFTTGVLGCGSDCRYDEADCRRPPAVTTAAIDAEFVTATGARFTGAVTDAGVPSLTDHGFCRGPSSAPALGGSGVICSRLGARTAPGSFQETVSGLTPDTTVYVRAYATNSTGTVYGTTRSTTTRAQVCGDALVSGTEQCDGLVPAGTTCVSLGFTTGTPACADDCRLDVSGCARLPVVTTGLISPDALGDREVAVEGTIVELGVPSPTQHGFCRGPAENPAHGDGGVVCSALGARAESGVFRDTLGGLTRTTEYHLRAFATNTAGTAYGEDRVFTTRDVPVCGDALVWGSEDCDGDTGRLGCATGVCGHDCGCVPTPTPPDGFVYVPPGAFTMGSPLAEAGYRGEDEAEHLVSVTRGFLLKATEVTQAEWIAGGGVSTGFGHQSAGLQAPAEFIDWYAALAFANAQSVASGLPECYTLLPAGCATDWADGDADNDGSACTSASWTGLTCAGFRLPTEAEWEYAARAGTVTATYLGDLESPYGFSAQPNLEPIAWYGYNSGVAYAGCYDLSGQGGSSCSGLHPVAGLLPNALGLYDMLGNVMEWVWDGYVLALEPGIDPTGPLSATQRVFRGGSWDYSAGDTRAARRSSDAPTRRRSRVGLRLAQTVSAP